MRLRRSVDRASLVVAAHRHAQLDEQMDEAIAVESFERIKHIPAEPDGFVALCGARVMRPARSGDECMVCLSMATYGRWIER